MVALVLAALTGKSTADFGKACITEARGLRHISRCKLSFLRTQEPIRRGLSVSGGSLLIPLSN